MNNNISDILTEVKVHLQYLNQKFGETVITNSLLAKLNNFEIRNLSDGYHSFNELYEFRKMYNAALFNQWAVLGKYLVHKSWKHHDGELCFGGGWFIVVAMLPTGQIRNHYKAEDWDLFQIPEAEKALYDVGGTMPADVLQRLKGLSYSSPAKVEARDKLNEYAEMQGWNKNKLIGWSEASDFAEWYATLQKPFGVESTSITEIIEFFERLEDENRMAIEQFKESHPWGVLFFRGRADALKIVVNHLEFKFNKEQWTKKKLALFGHETVR